MKKFLLWLLMVIALVALIVFGTIGYSYYKTDAAPPEINVSLEGKEFGFNGYEWNASVLRGLTYKTTLSSRTLSVEKMGELKTTKPELLVPENMPSSVTVKDADKNEVFNGSAAEFADFAFTKNGDYSMNVLLTIPPEEGESYGEFYYAANFTIAVEPKITISEERIYQGGVINVVVSDILDESIVPQIETDLSISVFTKREDYYTALIGIAYNREPGKYNINVRCGDTVTGFEVEVVHNEFERQDLTMSEEVSNATNTAAANAEFNREIVSLYNTADENTYWQGNFVQPCEGRITSEYGLRRYTNGAKVPVRHGGLDIACPEGTFVASPNNGKILFAGFLTLTGNTVVLEHGGGLKSYFYHMNSIAVEKGQDVLTGDKIGEVGTTGYSTGPHLHYEVKIGNQSINPWDLFNGTSGIFFN